MTLVHLFGVGATEPVSRERFGGKGAGLATMACLGVPVPPGCIIATDACMAFLERGRIPLGLTEAVEEALQTIGTYVGRHFGDATNPLLVSVRSGARVSMPGMMDTILNLGLNDTIVEGFAAHSGDPRFAYDCYRRFVEMYGDVVLGQSEKLEHEQEQYKYLRGIETDAELSAEDWRAIIRIFQRTLADAGTPVPVLPLEQLWGAISAVFRSWRNERALTYRRDRGIPDAWGTAVVIQAMVFGNRGDSSATGVAFTRDLASGKPVLRGEYLPNAQGEDVVGGRGNPRALTRAQRIERTEAEPSLEELLPGVYAELDSIGRSLEREYGDVQDIEFTVENGRLWILQTRRLQQTPEETVRSAVAMAGEGLTSREAAILKVEPELLSALLFRTIDPDVGATPVAHGLGASPGVATGPLVFSADDARRLTAQRPILARVETSPEDVAGMYASEGILTTRGGITSHAALIARGKNKPCIVGVRTAHIDVARKTLQVPGHVFAEGDIVTIDGSTGMLYPGVVPTKQPADMPELLTLLAWADSAARLAVRVNADTPEDAAVGRAEGAHGIGLCRTEHMFFGERIGAMRAMILATDEERGKALTALLSMQRDDFAAIFSAMRGFPVTIRLIDPPLHEFLPRTEEEIAETAALVGISAEALHARAAALHETNPMLGHRGCRLGITHPDIIRMQVRAMLLAAAADTEVEIMVPLIASAGECALVKDMIDAVARDVYRETGIAPRYSVGTMIELPRAALLAGEIAAVSSFFSFGTNDLTQTTFGISRDDAGSFLPAYLEKGVFTSDPFVRVDEAGVGELIRIATERGRAVRADLKLGICGEHGGEAQSIRFFHTVGLDYVSCSPYRVKVARLAAAHAALEG